ncbi:MAG: glycosyltransferase, partial [Hydrogenophaga sp.]|nr:glycosyltransferase [Hydrogenophaga sp.]
MKIINIISSLAFGGAETQIIKLSKQLVKMGHQVKIITLSDDNPRAEELANSGVELQIVPKKSKLDLTVVYNLYRAIKRWKPDIVHGYLYDAEFYARLAAWPTGIPVINSERNDSYKSNKTQYLGDLLTSGLTTSVIANSYAGKNFAMTRFPRLCA